MGTFKTIETTQKIGQIQDYFATMAIGQGAIRNDIVPALQSTGLSDQDLATNYPATTTLDAGWVHILNDMTPMIGAMSDSEPRYQAIASLPSFKLFPWFFVIPGAFVFFVSIAAAAGPPTRRTDVPEQLEPADVVSV
jgi:hypothetical protein